MKIKINMGLQITIETSCTIQWLGKKDSEGNYVDQETFSACATLSGYGILLEETKFGAIFLTEKEAIRSVKKMVRDTSKSFENITV